MGRVWGTTASIIFQTFCSIKMSKQNITHIPHPYLWGPTDRYIPFYSPFRDKLSLPRELVYAYLKENNKLLRHNLSLKKYHHWLSYFYFLFKCWKVLNLLCFFSTQIEHLNGLQTIIKLWTYCLWETVLSMRIRDSQHILNIESPALAQLSTIPHN